MKKLTATTLIITACLSTNVMAAHHSHDDYAKVISATPVYDHVAHKVPVQAGRNIDYRHKSSEPKHRSAVPVVVGGVIGGVVGHSIGSDRTNKQIGMIAGTIIGATIGANLEEGGRHHHHAPGYRYPTTYRVKHERILIGYDIIYQYHGHRYHTHTRHHPGKRIRLPEEVHSDRKHRHGHPGQFAMDMRHHDRRY